MIGFILLIPYTFVIALTMTMKVGISLYVSDNDLRLALGWLLLPLNLFGYEYRWLPSTGGTDTGKEAETDVGMEMTAVGVGNPLNAATIESGNAASIDLLTDQIPDA